MVTVRYIYGDVVNYPLIPVVIQFWGQKHSIKAVDSPHLQHPIILGTNWPGFNIIGVFMCGCLLETEKAGRGACALVGKAEPGSLRADPREGKTGSLY